MKIKKLNLGSGPTGINGWINFDWGVLPVLSKMPLVRSIFVKLGLLSRNYDAVWPTIKLVDIRKDLPLENKSIDYIYCSHVLEHFEKFEVIKIVKECKRVLKKNGLIRIVLPDLQKLIKEYKNADEFCREFYGYEKDVKSWSQMFIRGHEWMYDTKSFVKLLDEIGFKNCKVVKIKTGEMPDIDKLDLDVHEKLSMYIEARK